MTSRSGFAPPGPDARVRAARQFSRTAGEFDHAAYSIRDRAPLTLVRRCSAVWIERPSADWARCTNLITTYDDLRLGLVDASVMAVAERLGVTTIATLNHRNFAVVGPARCDALDLIP